MSQDPATSNRHSPLPWVLLALFIALIAGVTLVRQFRASESGIASSPPAAPGDSSQGTPEHRPSPDELRALASRSSSQVGAADEMARILGKRKRTTEATQARIQQRNAAMASRFAAEKSDPAWSGMHEKDLAALLDSDPMRDAGVKAVNFRADCRSTMCRIQADFPNRSMASDWLQLYMGSAGDRLPVATAHQVANPDGSVRVEILGVGREH